MPKEFPCPLCSKVLTRSTVLRDHLRAHAGEKPHACPHPGCGKSFTRRPDLLEHKKLHGETRQYVCEFVDTNGTKAGCGASFHRKRDLERHRKRAGGSKCKPIAQQEKIATEVRLDEAESLARLIVQKCGFTLQQPPQSEKAHSGPSVIRCSRCYLQCDDLKAYILHQDRHHSGAGRFFCAGLENNNDMIACLPTYNVDLIYFIRHCELHHGLPVNVSTIEEALTLLKMERNHQLSNSKLYQRLGERPILSVLPIPIREIPQRLKSWDDLSDLMDQFIFTKVRTSAESYDSLGFHLYQLVKSRGIHAISATTLDDYALLRAEVKFWAQMDAEHPSYWFPERRRLGYFALGYLQAMWDFARDTT